MQALPISSLLPAIKETLASATALVIEAPPGAGKTTLVPLALLEEPWLAGQKIMVLEPRRLAARAAAMRMAELLGESVGQTVGYRVRFDKQVSRDTRIEVVTEAILTRRLQQDPGLEGIGAVIFDEFHERNLHSDLALTLCLDIREALREELRLVVMSATLNGERMARFLEAPRLTSEGRQYPVEIHQIPEKRDLPLIEAVTRQTIKALANEVGDILVFLPGVREIRQVQQHLEERLADQAVVMHPLYADLPRDAQQQALRPDREGQRKVILATTIAETSLTIDGVSVVVDSGWVRAPRFDAQSGLSRLQTFRVTRAAAEQRCGRAGRQGPGVCYRLWGDMQQQGLIAYPDPEILQSDLTPLALELALWGVQDASSLNWLDAPPTAAMAQSRQLLQSLGAMDAENRITAQGRAMSRMAMHPRLAAMLSKAEGDGLKALACDIAALLSERDPLQGESRFECDLEPRLALLERYREHGAAAIRQSGQNPHALKSIDRLARDWRRGLNIPESHRHESFEHIGRLLAWAYPDRIAQLRDRHEGRYRLSNGKGARLADDSQLRGSPLLVVAEMGGVGQEAKIYKAAVIARDWLEQAFLDRIATRDRVYWDRQREAVHAVEERCLGELVLDRREAVEISDQQRTEAMLEAIRSLGLEALPWSDEARNLQARVLGLREWCPEQDWPDLSDAGLLNALDEWLSPYLHGISRRSHLQQLDLYAVLLAQLDYPLQQQLAELAPTHLPVPSGSRIRLQYEPGQPPVLAVKLQELFGLADTPTIAAGRVPVMLHLLSPARRPVQVTQDLKGFWDRTYAEVRKEMKGRYPKHPWPEKPWEAVPTARTKKGMGQ